MNKRARVLAATLSATMVCASPLTALATGADTALPADTDEQGYLIADESGVTSTPGIFAAGDIRTKQLRQVITAAADGANAVTSIENYLLTHS